MKKNLLLSSLMRLLSVLPVAIVAASICSCGLVSINESGYKKLSDEDKARVKRCEKPIGSLTYDGNIYQVDVAQMRDYLAEHGDVVVYEYATYCKSAGCINPKSAEMKCHEHGYDFCLIVSTYDYLERLPEMGVPMLAIYQKPYNTDKTPKYCRLFFDELTGVSDKVRGYGRFYYFKDGRFIKSYLDIDEVFAGHGQDASAG